MRGCPRSRTPYCGECSPERQPLLLLPRPRFDFGEAGRLLYDFVWSDFADWYIEAAKARLYGGDEAAAAQVGGPPTSAATVGLSASPSAAGLSEH